MPSKDLSNLSCLSSFLFSPWQERLTKCQDWKRPWRLWSKHVRIWKLRARKSNEHLQAPKDGCSRAGRNSTLPCSIPVLFSPHLTNAIILGLLCFSSRQEQHAKKARSMAEIWASLKRDGFIRQPSKVPVKAVFLHSIRQRTGGRFRLGNSLGSHLLIEVTVRFSTAWQMIKDFFSFSLLPSYFKATLGQITSKK